MESGVLLKEMTESDLMQKSVQLATSQKEFYAPILNNRIFIQIAIFLREMSNDNNFAKGLYSEDLNTHINTIKPTLENIDFYWNLL